MTHSLHHTQIHTLTLTHTYKTIEENKQQQLQQIFLSTENATQNVHKIKHII